MEFHTTVLAVVSFSLIFLWSAMLFKKDTLSLPLIPSTLRTSGMTPVARIKLSYSSFNPSSRSKCGLLCQNSKIKFEFSSVLSLSLAYCFIDKCDFPSKHEIDTLSIKPIFITKNEVIVIQVLKGFGQFCLVIWHLGAFGDHDNLSCESI